MGARSVHEALGIYTHDVHRRWEAGWGRGVSSAVCFHADPRPPPVMGQLNADILHHGPPPAYAHGREAVGGAEAWPQERRCTPAGVVRGARAAAGL